MSAPPANPLQGGNALSARERLLQSQQTIDRTVDRSQDTAKVARETEENSARVLEELYRQREGIEAINQSLSQVDANVAGNRRTLLRVWAMANCKRKIIWAILAVVLVVVLVMIAVAVARAQKPH
mmetsp:Transcript_32561/g.76457  ORF Transcript_32561/g.76457 Transcript_32561/m.76457 type:complete len:125 (-) Transcript_32561:89-463(-)